MKPAPIAQLLTSGTDPEIIARYEALLSGLATTEFGLEDEVCLLDLETTGLSSRSDRIIEIGIVKMRGTQVIDHFESLVNPGRPLPPIITEITGITDADLSDAPSFDEVADRVIDFIGDRLVIAYNAPFDRAFIEAAMPLYPVQWADALYLTRVGMPRLTSFKMAALAEVFAPDCAESMHRALSDARALARVWRAALCGIDTLSTPTLAVAVEAAQGSHPNEARWISQVLGARGETQAAYSLKQVRRSSAAIKNEPGLEDAWDSSLQFTQSDAVRELLAPDGSVFAAATVTEPYSRAATFEDRPEQVAMADEVYAAFADGTSLVIEAGTGVGKSLAYLVPAALAALENSVSVGVATKTNSLTDQLMSQELPRVAHALSQAGHGALRFASVKGYENYLCLRKVASAQRVEESSAGIGPVLAWIEQTPWGDVDSMSPLVLGNLDRSLRATQPECTKKRCPYYPNLCYIHGARKRAQSAHVVVTNHSLMLRDAAMDGQILPPIRYWIVDEAHSLEREARKQLSSSLSSYGLLQLLDRRLALGRDPLRTIRLATTGLAGQDRVAGLLDDLAREREAAITLSESFFSAADELFATSSDGPYGVRAWVSYEVRESAAWGSLVGIGNSLHGRLLAVLATIKSVSESYADQVADATDTLADLAGATQELRGAIESLGAFIAEPDENSVHSVEISRRGRSLAQADSAVREERQVRESGEWVSVLPSIRVNVEQMDVGPAIVENLLSRTSSIVFTSATLATGSTEPFSHFARAVGLSVLEPDRWRTRQLPSSYDLASQMEIYVVSDMPDPRAASYHAELQRLLERVHVATHGGVLTLFTSDRDMRACHAAVQPALEQRGLPLYYQRQGSSPRAIREQFASEHDSSLFALKRFWEGFDVRGQSLRCVVIPRLPFSVPEDPLSRAREFREGSAAWRRYTLPETVIETRQAVGRLIRSSTDVGAIIIADSRLATKSYGKTILRAMPVEPKVLPADEVVAQIQHLRPQV